MVPSAAVAASVRDRNTHAELGRRRSSTPTNGASTKLSSTANAMCTRISLINVNRRHQKTVETSSGRNDHLLAPLGTRPPRSGRGAASSTSSIATLFPAHVLRDSSFGRLLVRMTCRRTHPSTKNSFQRHIADVRCGASQSRLRPDRGRAIGRFCHHGQGAAFGRQRRCTDNGGVRRLAARKLLHLRHQIATAAKSAIGPNGWP